MKERIVLNPADWPQDTFGGRGTYNHIRFDQPTPPPEALWEALQVWAQQRPKADTFWYWWKDLSPYHPSLKGWKLTGHGNMPLTVLLPGEKPRKGDIKLALVASQDADWLDVFQAWFPL